MRYPCNYGYIPKTLAKDGDPVDVIVATPMPLIHGSVIRCRPIGVLAMTDEAGDDGLGSIKPDDPKGASEWLVIGGLLLRSKYEAKKSSRFA